VAPLSFRGEPYVVDIVLRPVLSGARWVVGVALGGLLWWLDLILWVPVPVVVSTAIMETWLALRSDRPIRIDIDGERLVVDDRFAPTLTVFRDRVRACTVLHQPRKDAGRAGHEVVVVVAGPASVLLAIAVQTPELPALGSTAVDVARQDACLGARAGLLRATAPVTRICRQRVHDADLVHAIVDWAGPAAEGRRALRVWAGPAPELSPFGLHPQDATGLLLLDNDGWQLELDDETRCGPRSARGARVVEREAILLGVEGEEAPSAGVLPLLVVTLAAQDGSSLHVAIPAPGHGGREHPEAPLEAFHTHAPEGAVLLAWLEEVGALPELPSPPDREPSPIQGDTPSTGLGDAPQ